MQFCLLSSLYVPRGLSHPWVIILWSGLRWTKLLYGFPLPVMGGGLMFGLGAAGNMRALLSHSEGRFFVCPIRGIQLIRKFS